MFRMQHTHRLYATILFLCIATPFVSTATDDTTPREQDFVLTAYYSPKPNQCCYVTGSEQSDKDLNGNGTNGADGTKVYPGMIAAPPSYAFGTRIVLPGLGIGTVHDRGGAIQEQGKVHRLDVWVGSGEEGLARALAFGVKHVRGTIYPVGSKQPAEKLALETLPAPLTSLSPYMSVGLLDVKARFGESGLGIRLLQTALKNGGSFDHAITGTFGEVTKTALAAFISRMKLTEPTDQLTEKTAAYLQATADTASRVLPFGLIDAKSSSTDIQSAKRLLRGMDLYKGRTDGVYSDDLKKAITAFQIQKKLIADANETGAGRIGPKTHAALEQEWKLVVVARQAQNVLFIHSVQMALEKKGMIPQSKMKVGSNGADVKRLQSFLASKGFFPKDKINGNFGEVTKASLLAYQKARGLVKNDKDTGAGTVGPFTLQTMKTELVATATKRVKEHGWDAL